MKFFVSALMVIGFISPAFAVDQTQKVMAELGTDLDIAETSLKILNGEVSSNKSCDDKLGAALSLLNFERRHPGYLKSAEYSSVKWQQFQHVRALNGKLEEKHQFFYRATLPPAPAKGAAR